MSGIVATGQPVAFAISVRGFTRLCVPGDFWEELRNKTCSLRHRAGKPTKTAQSSRHIGRPSACAVRVAFRDPEVRGCVAADERCPDFPYAAAVSRWRFLIRRDALGPHAGSTHFTPSAPLGGFQACCRSGLPGVRLPPGGSTAAALALVLIEQLDRLLGFAMM